MKIHSKSDCIKFTTKLFNTSTKQQIQFQNLKHHGTLSIFCEISMKPANYHNKYIKFTAAQNLQFYQNNEVILSHSRNLDKCLMETN